MSELVAQAACGQHIGQRARQEDAIIAQFPEGAQPGFAVLSDGMGGHDDGDLAGRILASEMFGELYLATARSGVGPDTPGHLFRAALDRANMRLKQHIDAGWISADTGGTLVGVIFENGTLRWLSVGDSPLYLYREGALRQINEVHSMSTQLDLMVRNGALDREAAAQHPHRHCLTSAVTGQKIQRIDCPNDALQLAANDIIVLASDGLNVLEDDEIADLIRKHAGADSTGITRALLKAVRRRDAPHQDNVSLVVIRLMPRETQSPVTSGQGIGTQFIHLLRRILPDRLQAASPVDQRAEP